MFLLLQIANYETKLGAYLEELGKLTKRVDGLLIGPDDYIKLDFELLRVELREFEALVSELRDSLNVSSSKFDSLYAEVKEAFFKKTCLQWT